MKFESKGMKQSANINGLVKGATCYYRIVSECGAPSFTLSDLPDNVNVTYVEVDREAADLSDNTTTRALAASDGDKRKDEKH